MAIFKDTVLPGEEKKPRGPVHRWVVRIIKVLLFLAVAVWIGLVMLSRLGEKEGSIQDAMQGGIIRFVSDVTDADVTVEAFDTIRLYPVMLVDMAGVFAGADANHPLLKIKRVKVGASFWGAFLGRQRLFGLSVDELYASSALTGIPDLRIRKLDLSPDPKMNGTATLIFDGTIGGHEMAFDMSLFVKMKRHIPVYKLGKDNPFTLKVADVAVKGHLVKAGGDLAAQIDEIKHGETTLTGPITIQSRNNSDHLESDAALGQSSFVTNLEYKENSVKGDVFIKTLLMSDMSAFTQLVKRIQEILSVSTGTETAKIDFGDWDVDVRVDIETLKTQNHDVGSLGFGLVLKDKVLSVSSLQGDIDKGSLSGRAELNAQSLPAKLTTQGYLKKWYVFKVLEADNNALADKTPRGNLAWGFDGEGETYEELIKSLAGDAHLIVGNGELPVKKLNNWGAGLFSAILPSLDKDSESVVNCIVMRFETKEGVAKADPIFMDTKRIVLVGEGTIDLSEQKMKIKLIPESKNPALLDVAPAVKLKGPVFSPEVSVDSGSVIKKLGGLAAGVLNPGLLLVTMTDLGISDDHPCRGFVNSQGESLDQDVQEIEGFDKDTKKEEKKAVNGDGTKSKEGLNK